MNGCQISKTINFIAVYYRAYFQNKRRGRRTNKTISLSGKRREFSHSKERDKPHCEVTSACSVCKYGNTKMTKVPLQSSRTETPPSHGRYLDTSHLPLIPAVQPISGCRGHMNGDNIHGAGCWQGEQREPPVACEASFSLRQRGHTHTNKSGGSYFIFFRFFLYFKHPPRTRRSLSRAS